MTDEKSLRRPDFVDGIRLRLADGRHWTIPMPVANPGSLPRESVATADGPPWFRRDYEEVLEAVCEAEDAADLLRAGLALTICLLRRNYDLGPEELTSLLCFDDRNALATMQEEVGRIAAAHLRAFRGPMRSDSSSMQEGRDNPLVRTSPIGAFSS